MTKIDTYKHLNDESKLHVEIDIPKLAEMVCSLNYGAHRMLSAMVHVLRAKHDAYRERMKRENGWDLESSPLADGIEALLKETR